MLTLEDCFALSELCAAEVDAIAEHEHLPEVVAAELGNYLVRTADGQMRSRGVLLAPRERMRGLDPTRRQLDMVPDYVVPNYIGGFPREPGGQGQARQ